MSTITDLKTQAQQLRKNKCFSDALPLYQALWEIHRDACNEWDGWGYAQCLSKMNRHDLALDVCREVYRIKPDFQMNTNLYAWAIYHTEIKRETVNDEQKFLKAARAIMRLTRQDASYSPYVRTVFTVAKYFENRHETRAALVWLLKIDMTLLRNDVHTLTTLTGEKREQASDREHYYATISKALIAIEDYQSCITICEAALAECPTFHYDNDIWFKRRIALSKYHLGDPYDAVAMLQNLLHQRREWFILYEIAEIYADLGDVTQTWVYATKAALAHGDIAKKWKLFELMADVLAQSGQVEEAKKHIALVYKIHLEHGWTLGERLKERVAQFELNVEHLPHTERLARQLKQLWEREKPR